MDSREEARRIFIALILVALGLVFVTILPFGAGLVFAAVLAATFYPLHLRLTAKLRGRANLSASIFCLGVLMLLLLPVGGVGAFIVSEVVKGANFVIDTVQSDGMSALVEKLPASLQNAARHAMGMFIPEPENLDSELKRHAGAHGGQAARFVSRTLTATGSMVIQATLSLIALFFFLVDGKSFVDWLEENSPLMPDQLRELLSEFRLVSTTVLVSTVVTSGVQAAVAQIGYLIARVPHPFFFGIATFFIAFIPAIGAGSVCFAAALLLLALGKIWAALFLGLWLIPVSVVDNLIKPLLVQRGIHMHGGIVFFALLGGIAAFGAVGLLLGPLFVASLIALARIYKRDFSRRAQQSPPTSKIEA